MIRSRIAPTPSGYLHIGNALNFLITWQWVRREGGRLRLRIDDSDSMRVRPELLEDIFLSLEWMGLDWDEGPHNAGEQERLYSQSLRAARYAAMIEQLIGTGRVYACECSRTELKERPCGCRHKQLPLDMPDTALRIMTPDLPIIVNDVKGRRPIPLNEVMHDFVIRRRDGIAAYQVVSLADDLDQEINLIVRGMDLLESTAAQLYLASLTGAERFSSITFYHHPLLLDDEGHKLSKSAGSTSLKAMREAGMSGEEFREMMEARIKQLG
jgi:glutamyl/glutaminyl-tRNA synthetase